MKTKKKIIESTKNPGLKLVYTQGTDPDFQFLCSQLDKTLDQAIGGHAKRTKFLSFNKADSMDLVVLAYREKDNQNLEAPYMQGRPTACGAYRIYDPDTIEIKRIFVADDARRKGIGSIIVNELLAHGKSQGFQRAVLETGEFLSASVKLYERMGFYRIPNYPPYENITESLCMEAMLHSIAGPSCSL